MKFINAKYVPSDWVEFAEENNATIQVQFCRDCPFFEYDGVQPDLPIRHGWCRRLSYYETIDGDWPHYVHTNDTSFCNADDIKVYEKGD